MNKRHKKLRVWGESIRLVEILYRISELLPSSEKFGLISQMKRASVSIPSNIAEGAARQHRKELLHFCSIARGSLSELDTQIELCLRLAFLSPNDVIPLLSQMEAVDSLLSGLIRSLKNS